MGGGDSSGRAAVGAYGRPPFAYPGHRDAPLAKLSVVRARPDRPGSFDRNVPAAGPRLGVHASIPSDWTYDTRPLNALASGSDEAFPEDQELLLTVTCRHTGLAP